MTHCLHVYTKLSFLNTSTQWQLWANFSQDKGGLFHSENITTSTSKTLINKVHFKRKQQKILFTTSKETLWFYSSYILYIIQINRRVLNYMTIQTATMCKFKMLPVSFKNALHDLKYIKKITDNFKPLKAEKWWLRRQKWSNKFTC